MPRSKKDKEVPRWKLHDSYSQGVSARRITTRSQTSLLRVKRTPSNLALFSDPRRHQPPDMPHLIETLKGRYGSIQRTVITRSTGKKIPVSGELNKKLDLYKTFDIGVPLGKEPPIVIKQEKPVAEQEVKVQPKTPEPAAEQEVKEEPKTPEPAAEQEVKEEPKTPEPAAEQEVKEESETPEPAPE